MKQAVTKGQVLCGLTRGTHSGQVHRDRKQGEGGCQGLGSQCLTGTGVQF